MKASFTRIGTGIPAPEVGDARGPMAGTIAAITELAREARDSVQHATGVYFPNREFIDGGSADLGTLILIIANTRPS